MSDKKPERKPRSTFTFEGRRYERTGRTQKEADQKAARLEESLKRGEAGISSDMTVARWANEWFETYKKPSVGKSHAQRYTSYIQKIIIPAIGGLRLKQVKDVHLQKILNERVGKSRDDLSKLRMTLHAMFQRAYKSKLILYNPAEDLELPAAPQEGSHRSITPYEREKILALAETHHAGLWIKTLLYTGLRPGESMALDWRNIDFDKRLIHVEAAVKAGTNDLGQPKSAAGVRDIPIPDTIRDALIAAKRGPFEPVFTQPTTGRRHTQTSIRRLWENFKRELDISMGAKIYRSQIIIHAVADDLVPYCLRHTYCTDLQDAGVPINIARALMGHSDIKMTSRIYTHTTETALRDAADKINAHSGKPGGMVL